MSDACQLRKERLPADRWESPEGHQGLPAKHRLLKHRRTKNAEMLPFLFGDHGGKGAQGC